MGIILLNKIQVFLRVLIRGPLWQMPICREFTKKGSGDVAVSAVGYTAEPKYEFGFQDNNRKININYDAF